MRLPSVIKNFTVLFLALSWLSAIPQKNSARGDRYFDLNQFDEAISYYQKDVRSRKKEVSQHAMQKLADSYRITGDFAKAEETYKKIMSRKKKDPLTYLNYGLALKNSAKYAEAIELFKEYLKLRPDDPMGRIYLMSCDSAQKWLDESIGKEVKNLDEINSAAPDISPVIVGKDKLMFSSSREGSTKKLVSFSEADNERLDLYQVKMSDIEGPAKSNRIRNVKDLNSPLHEGPACFSSDGSEIYFTRTMKGRRDRRTNKIVGTLQVFRSTKDSSGKWSEPQSAFSFNSTDYSVGHPSLANDGNTIFFMSDKPGGFGKTDIYFSKKQPDGDWGPPVNAGSSVNTFGHELFPAVSGNSILFFSSDGHPGMGQLDIFKAAMYNGKWAQVRNLKPPVNSIANDFGISFYKGHQKGFFCSDRFNGKGAEDIYSFTENVPMEILLIHDSLFVHDYSLFDDMKFKLINESDGHAEEFTNVDGLMKSALQKEKTYILETHRYGRIENQVFIRYSRDSLQKSITFKIATSHKMLNISGKTFVGIHKKGTVLKRDPKKTCSVLGNISFGELEMGIDKKGYYTFNALMDPGKQSIICSQDVVRFEGD